MKAECKNSPFTLTDIEIQVALDNLERGMLAVMGGEVIAKWVKNNKQGIEHIFASLDECCISFKDEKTAKDFITTLQKVKFNTTQDLTQYVSFIKPKNNDKTLLIFRWD